jgi:hypothetical protein
VFQEIVAVKRQIQDIVTHLTRIQSSGGLRLAFIGYRDFGYAHSTVLPFVHADKVGVKIFQQFMLKVRASSNDLSCHDICEDVAGGLRLAVELNWQQPTRFIFHIGDAPPHGSRYYLSTRTWSNGSEPWDCHPRYDHTGVHGIPAQIAKMQQLNVQYAFARVDRVGKGMHAHLDRMVAMINRDANDTNFVKVSQLDSTAALTMAVVSSDTASAEHTVSRMRKPSILSAG